MKNFSIAFVMTMFGCSAATDSSHQASISQRAAGNCTYTQGYWKNHAKVWPVASLNLGATSYTEPKLLDIFHTAVKGNGLVALAHQLTATKLNVASGADASVLGSAISSADALIARLVVPSVGSGTLATDATSVLVDSLDSFNSGIIGPGHCSESLPPPVCGDGLLEGDETCDDGNTVNGDGCTSTCQHECEYTCGNGRIEPGEQCDDGNAISHDGCSSACTTEALL